MCNKELSNFLSNDVGCNLQFCNQKLFQCSYSKSPQLLQLKAFWQSMVLPGNIQFWILVIRKLFLLTNELTCKPKLCIFTISQLYILSITLAKLVSMIDPSLMYIKVTNNLLYMLLSLLCTSFDKSFFVSFLFLNSVLVYIHWRNFICGNRHNSRKRMTVLS